MTCFHLIFVPFYFIFATESEQRNKLGFSLSLCQNRHTSMIIAERDSIKTDMSYGSHYMLYFYFGGGVERIEINPHPHPQVVIEE
jgi:hypothetical protein